MAALNPISIIARLVQYSYACLWHPLVSLWTHKDLFLALVKRDLAEKTSGTVLGAFWLLAQPALQVLAFWFLLDVILQVRFPGNIAFVDYFLIGMIPWICVNEVLNRSIRLYQEFHSIFAKTPFPLEVLPLLIIAIAVLIYTPIYMAVAFLLHGMQAVLPALAVMLIIALWLLPISYLFSILGVFIRDFAQAVPFILTMTLYLTPILYMPQMVPEAFQHYLVFNPIADLMLVVHGIVEPETGFVWPAALRLFIEWLVILAPAWWMFQRSKKHIRDAV